MNTQNHLRSLLLVLTLIGVSTATSRTQADQEGTKPYKGIQFQLERDDTLGPDYWNDPFLIAAREIATGTGDYFGDSEIWSEGRDNVGGVYTAVAHQILYLTSATTADWYIWTETTRANGDKSWSSAVGEVDFVNGTVSGTWEGYAENDPTSDVTGSGVVEGANSGDRLNVSLITGRVATVGAKNNKE